MSPVLVVICRITTVKAVAMMGAMVAEEDHEINSAIVIIRCIVAVVAAAIAINSSSVAASIVATTLEEETVGGGIVGNAAVAGVVAIASAAVETIRTIDPCRSDYESWPVCWSSTISDPVEVEEGSVDATLVELEVQD